MEKIPFITKELIDYISRMYPDVSPELSWSDREIWSKRGAVGVVRHLRRIYEEQCKQALLGDSK